MVGHYQHTLGADSRGLNYLKQERGIADNQSIKDFGAGYANGTWGTSGTDIDILTKPIKHIQAAV